MARLLCEKQFQMQGQQSKWQDGKVLRFQEDGSDGSQMQCRWYYNGYEQEQNAGGELAGTRERDAMRRMSKDIKQKSR